MQLPFGYTVRYRHHRKTGVIWPPLRLDGGAAPRLVIEPKGGRTTACIFDEEGTYVAEGEARCRPDERYHKKIGREIAYGRALKHLERHWAGRRGPLLASP